MKTVAQTRWYTNRVTHNQNSWKHETLNIILYKTEEQKKLGEKEKEEKERKNIPRIDKIQQQQ